MDFFVKRHNAILNLSSAVRDSILPHEYVQIEVENDDIVFIPTDDESKYKVSIPSKGQRQAKICIFYASGFIKIPIGIRLYGDRRSDGAIVIHIGQDV